MAEQEVRLQDIFDMDFIQHFQDEFARAVGMTAVTVDLDGTPVTHPTDWTDFCMKYTRGCPKGKERCEKCDADNGAKAAREGKPQVYECHAGLMDFAAPIMLNGKQVGSILGGQVLTQPLDEEKYRRVAREIGVDPEAYVAAARKVQVVDKARLDHAAQTLYLFAGAFSKMGYYQHRLKQMSESINDTTMHVSAAMEQLAASARDVDSNQKALSEEIKTVSEVAGKITEFTRLIEDIAKQTQLLGRGLQRRRGGDPEARGELQERCRRDPELHGTDQPVRRQDRREGRGHVGDREPAGEGDRGVRERPHGALADVDGALQPRT